MHEQVWQWLSEPLRQLRYEARTEPAVAWPDRLPAFLAQLGMTSTDQHPVVRQLHEHMTALTVEQQTELLLDDRVETLVYEWAVQLTALAAEVAELVVQRIALPVLTELSAREPGLLATPGLNQILSAVLAERLQTA